MGKYIKKAKTTGEVSLMDMTQSSLGVRTRAKTLALQRLQKSAAAATPTSGSYLQLRSRRLEKPPLLVSSHDSKKQKQTAQKQINNGCLRNPSPRAMVNLSVAGSVGSGSGENGPLVKNLVVGSEKEEAMMVNLEEEVHEKESNDNGDLGIEASFGENILDFEGRERSTRESTPCSLIRNPDTVRTPGSTTRPTSSAGTNRRIQNSTQRHIPTTHEMEAFFGDAEEQQQREFIEKYNFDPVNDKPLPGRYEWVKLDP